MKKKFLLPGIVLLAGMANSCEKEPELVSEELITYKFNAYYPMSVGSYWVYEYNSYSAEGVPTSSDPLTYDTVRITSQKTINQKEFFVFESNYPLMNGEFYRRDSAGYIISESGAILLTPEPAGGTIFNNRVNEIAEDIYVNMWSRFPDFDHVSVPVGDFTALQRTDFFEFQGIPFEGTVMDTSYFSKIGVLQRGFVLFSGSKIRGKLVSFHLE